MEASNFPKGSHQAQSNKAFGEEKPKGKGKSDLSDTGLVADQATAKGDIGLEDSFQRLYSKELDLDEDEVPIILHELNDSAIHFISRDQYERALSLLQKAQTLIDRLQFQKNPNDRLMVYLTMHNMALCFQKLGALEECALCLEASITTLNSQYLRAKGEDSQLKLKRLKYECKTHMQICALLSQLHRHKEALVHAEKSVQIAQYMVEDMLQMCKVQFQRVLIAKKNEQLQQDQLQMTDESQEMRDLIYYDDSVSMLERTAYRVYPIILECAQKMIGCKDVVGLPGSSKPKLNMKALLGYLNQSEWLYLLNIGNIMQITPMTVHDLYSSHSFEIELTRDSILEKISFLSVSYFCISTELRFLVQLSAKNNSQSAGTEEEQEERVKRKKESEFWHAKALDVAISFLPSECPLVTHILTSYQKHHSPVQQEIVRPTMFILCQKEDEEAEHGLKVIRPLPGIDVCKFQPMVRQDPDLKISINPLQLSPNNYSASICKKQTKSNNQANQSSISPNNQQHKSLIEDSSITYINPLKQSQKNLNPPKSAMEEELLFEELRQQLSQDMEDDKDLFGEQNKSMVELLPSSQKKYQKLLQEFQSGKHQKSEEPKFDEYESEEDDDHFKTETTAMKQHTAQEIGLLFEQQLVLPKRRQQTVGSDVRGGSVGRSRKQDSKTTKQSVITKGIEDQDEEEFYMNEQDSKEEDLQGGSIDRKNPKKNQNTHNLSMDNFHGKRPKTSQGVRQSNPSLKQKSAAVQRANLRGSFQKNQLIPSIGSVEKISPHAVSRVPSGRQQGIQPSKQKKQVGKASTVMGGSSPIKSNSLTGIGYQTNPSLPKQAIFNLGQILVAQTAQSRCLQSDKSGEIQQRTTQSSQSETVVNPKRHTQRAMKQLPGGALPLDLTPTHHQVSASSGNTTSKKAQQYLIQQSMQQQRSSSSQSRHQVKRAGSPQIIDDSLLVQHYLNGSQSMSHIDGKRRETEGGKKLKHSEANDFASGVRPSTTLATRSKSRGKAKPMEELKRHIVVQNRSGVDISGGTQRRKNGKKSGTPENTIPPQTSGQWLNNAHQLLMSQSNTALNQQNQLSNQWLKMPSGNSIHLSSSNSLSNIPQQKQIKVNTHQLIKKFLQDRQLGTGSTQPQPQTVNESSYNIQSYLTAQTNNYKMQLSRKIIQQQQKLLMSGAVVPANQTVEQLKKTKIVIPKGEAVLATGYIKRSATPMIEMIEPQKPIYPGSLPLTTTVGSVKLLAGMPISAEGKATPDPNQLTKLTGQSLDYFSSQRDDSLTKSAKKKIQAKRAASNNVPSNNQQMSQ